MLKNIQMFAMRDNKDYKERGLWDSLTELVLI